MITTNLPPKQQQFVDGYDGTLQYILDFRGLPTILNPVFSAHYFVDHVTHDDKVVSTRDTTGEWGYWDTTLTEQKVRNAYTLAKQIKEILRTGGAYVIGNKYYINMQGVQRRIVGLTTKNI